jgi:hypothetical protein
MRNQTNKEDTINILIGRDSSVPIDRLYAKYVGGLGHGGLVALGYPADLTKETVILRQKVTIQLIDSPSEKENFYPDNIHQMPDSIILALSLNNEHTSKNPLFDTINKKLSSIIIDNPSLPIIVLGVDEGTEIKYDATKLLEMAYKLKEEFEHSNYVEFMECSLQTGQGITEAFDAAATAAVKYRAEELVSSQQLKIKKSTGEKVLKKVKDFFNPKKTSKNPSKDSSESDTSETLTPSHQDTTSTTLQPSTILVDSQESSPNIKYATSNAPSIAIAIESQETDYITQLLEQSHILKEICKNLAGIIAKSSTISNEQRLPIVNALLDKFCKAKAQSKDEILCNIESIFFIKLDESELSKLTQNLLQLNQLSYKKEMLVSAIEIDSIKCPQETLAKLVEEAAYIKIVRNMEKLHSREPSNNTAFTR